MSEKNCKFAVGDKVRHIYNDTVGIVESLNNNAIIVEYLVCLSNPSKVGKKGYWSRNYTELCKETDINTDIITTPEPEEQEMKQPNERIETIVEINGTPIADLVPSDILHMIGNARNKLDKMKNHQEHSKFAVRECERLEAYIAKAYRILDENFLEDE